MDDRVLKTAYELAYSEPVSESLTPEELLEAEELADFLCCPSCGE